MKVTSFLCPIKDNLGLKTASIYSIPCNCGRIYIEQTGVPLRPGSKSTISTSDYHLEKLAVAKESINLGEFIQFHETSILARKSECMKHIIREAF
jgi:hypothetical protein